MEKIIKIAPTLAKEIYGEESIDTLLTHERIARAIDVVSIKDRHLIFSQLKPLLRQQLASSQFHRDRLQS
jgi:hypothetical protein